MHRVLLYRPDSVILLFSASPAAEMTGVHHHAQILVISLDMQTFSKDDIEVVDSSKYFPCSMLVDSSKWLIPFYL